MDVTGALTQIEAAVTGQLALSGHDPELAEVAGALLGALQPAVRQAVFELAQQAAAEVDAQLPGHAVTVTLSDGEPMLDVRAVEETTVPSEGYEARLTLRLPDALKSIIEEAAGHSGDSVNSWVVKTLSTKASTPRSGSRVKTRIDL